MNISAFGSIAVMPLYLFCFLAVILTLAKREEEDEMQVKGGGGGKASLQTSKSLCLQERREGLDAFQTS